GYAVGRLLEQLAMAVARRAEIEVTMAGWARRTLRWGWPVIMAVVVIATPFFTLRQHQRTAEIIGATAPTIGDVLLATVVALIFFALLMSLWWGLTALVGWTSRQLNRALPRWVSQTIATVVVIALLGTAIDRLVIETFIDRAESAAHTVNALGLTDDPPETSLRSGSPESPESWATLGHAGRTFVLSGPTQDEITQVTGEPALEPIRVYAGLTQDRDLADTAAAVVAELERTGAFEREAIMLISTTGTGWVN